MPALKRKATSSSFSVKKQATASSYHGQTSSTHGMMAAAMVDDMIDDDDQDDSDDDEEEEEEQDEEEQEQQDLDQEVSSTNEFQDLETEKDSENVTSRPKKNDKALFRPPTVEEMEMLKREGEERGSSFGFSMKITELLKSTFLDPLPPAGTSYTPTAPAPILSQLLTSLHTHLVSLPSLPSVSIELAEQRLAPHRIPFLDPRPGGKETKWTLGWERPEEVFVAGDWSLMGFHRKGRKGKEAILNEIDMAIVMPRSLFSPKDRTNNRYFQKRAHYMTVIASSLATLIGGKQRGKSGEKVDQVWAGVEVRWDWVRGDERRAGLVLDVPKNKSLGIKHSYSIRLLPSISPDLFPLATLYPTKSNLRTKSYQEESDSLVPLPTPMYNNSILLDSSHRAHLLYLHHLHKSCPGFRSALALWRIWGDRRGLPDVAQGWSWLGAMVFGFIIDGGHVGVKGKEGLELRARKGLGKGLSEWQLLRAGLELLSSTDFKKSPLFMKSSSEEKIPATEFVKVFDQVFVDPTGTINIFGAWETGQVELLRYESRVTLNMLGHAGSSDRFEEVFLRHLRSPELRFDEVFRVDLPAEQAGGNPDHASHAQRSIHAIAALLRRGLGQRARLVSVTCPRPGSWSTTGPCTETDGTIEIGLLLNKDQAFGILDQGPPSEDTAGSEAFRQLWKSKSELRRFKDGTITESVVWNAARPEERSLIPGMVVKWLLHSHFGFEDDEIRWQAPNYLPLTQIPESAHRLVHAQGSEKLGFRPVMDAFDHLYKTIKAADEELPLSLLNFSPMDSALRYSSTFIPYAMDMQRAASAPECVQYMPVVDVLIQYESSRKWPDDLVAIQKIKLAVLVKTAGVIQSKLPDVQVNVVLDPNAPDIQDNASLEVIMSSGHAFHLHVYHDRERTLLERMIEDADTPTEKMRRVAQDAYDVHFRRFTAAPRHHGAIVTLHHMYPSFASASRLLKRWVSSHLLSAHIPEEMLELIMASVYLDPGAHDVPTTAHAGFIRAIDLLAHWAWRDSALLVPLYTTTRGHEQENSAVNVSFPVGARKQAEAAFEALRKMDKDFHKSTMVIVTEEDLLGRAWLPLGRPHRLIASRLVTLAQATLKAVQAEEMTPQSLFVTDMTEYDFILHLNPKHASRLAESIAAYEESKIAQLWEGHVRNQAVSGMAAQSIRADFDPVASFHGDLQRLYGEQAIFFHDKHGGQAIAGLWNPDVLQHRNFKPFLGYSVKPVAGTKKTVTTMTEIDKSGILSEMERMGHGLITRVEVLRHE